MLVSNMSTEKDGFWGKTLYYAYRLNRKCMEILVTIFYGND